MAKNVDKLAEKQSVKPEKEQDKVLKNEKPDKHEKEVAKDFKTEKPDKHEKEKEKELKHEKPDKHEKEKEHGKDFKTEKPDKHEKEKEKELKHEKPDKHEKEKEKFETKEKIEKNESEAVGPVHVGPGDPVELDSSGTVEERVARLEQTLSRMAHFIGVDLRPDLSKGALKQEPAETSAEVPPGKPAGGGNAPKKK